MWRCITASGSHTMAKEDQKEEGETGGGGGEK